MNLFTSERKAQGAVVEARRQEARWTEAESLEEVNTESTVVISYPSRPRLVRPLDTGPENVNRLSTVRLNGGSTVEFAGLFYSWRIAVLTDLPFREKEIARITWPVDGQGRDAGSDCLDDPRSLAQHLETYVLENFPWLMYSLSILLDIFCELLQVTTLHDKLFYFYYSLI